MIEESSTLQEGTEMGRYMMQKGQEVESSSHRVASRAPAGHLRMHSFARRVAQTAWGLWTHAIAEEKRLAKEEAVLQQNRYSRRASGSVSGLEGSSGTQSRRTSRTYPSSRRNSKQALEPRGSKEIDENQLQELASKMASYLVKGQDLPEKAALLPGSFAQAVASQPTRKGMLLAAVEKTMTGQKYQNASKDAKPAGPAKDASKKDADAQDEEKTSKNPKRRAPARSPEQSPRGPRERPSYDVLRPNRRDEQLRRERLLDDSMYVEDQMDKLRKGKVLLKDALANTSPADLFENANLYTPYAQQIRRRKDQSSGKELGDAMSLPNLQRPENVQNGGRNRLQSSRSNFYEVKKDDKKKGAEIPASVATLKVRDLQHIILKSQDDLMNPKEEKSARNQLKTGKAARGSFLKAIRRG